MSHSETDMPHEKLPSLKHSLDLTQADEEDEEKTRRQVRKLDLKSIARTVFSGKVYQLNMAQFLKDNEDSILKVMTSLKDDNIDTRCELVIKLFGFTDYNSDQVFSDTAVFFIQDQTDKCKLYRYYADREPVLVSYFVWENLLLRSRCTIRFFMSKYCTELK